MAADFPLHRPELLHSLRRGDDLLLRAMGGKAREFENRDEIIRTGEPCETIFRLEKGWVGRTRVLDDGRRSIIGILLPGDLFGVKSFLFAEQPDSVHSFGRSSALAIQQQPLRQLFAAEADVALRIAFQLAEDERRLHNYVIGLGRANALERIAMMLIELHGRLVRGGSCSNGSYQCPLTQQDLGDLLGLTVVHVNRTLRRLHGEGVVTVSHGIVHIHDIDALHDLAQPVLDIFERTRPEFGGHPN